MPRASDPELDPAYQGLLCEGPARFAAIDWALQGASRLQTRGMQRRLAGTPVEVDARVISIGNLTTGGTGKTPAVIAMAERLVETGAKVAVVTRGYGSSRTPEPFVPSADLVAWKAAALAGDEPALIRDRVPQVSIVKSADRVAGAQYAIARLGSTHILLDDGYQAVSLARDENVCLLDASAPFGNGYILPRGSLREPVAALERATQFWITGIEGMDSPTALRDWLSRHFGSTPISTWRRQPKALVQVRSGEILGLEKLHGARVRAAAAIARPEPFFETLRRLGAVLESTLVARDHRPLSEYRINAAPMAVVTEKDAVRMRAPSENVYALRIALEQEN